MGYRTPRKNLRLTIQRLGIELCWIDLTGAGPTRFFFSLPSLQHRPTIWGLTLFFPLKMVSVQGRFGTANPWKLRCFAGSISALDGLIPIAFERGGKFMVKSCKVHMMVNPSKSHDPHHFFWPYPSFTASSTNRFSFTASMRSLEEELQKTGNMG